jgi:thiamine biosynthesis lipoprotein
MRNWSKCSLISLIFTSFPGGFASAEWVRVEESERLMGVDFRVVLYARAAEPGRMAAGRALARVEALNQILSDYVADSEVRRLVRDRERHKVSTELWQVLSYGQSVARESQGAFDVTVGPYVLAARQYRFFRKLPPPEKLARMKASVGFDKLKLFPESREVACVAPAMRVDLGGLAKGYAVDEALGVLRELGYTRAMVDGGGDLAVSDAPPGKPHWEVQVEGAIDQVLSLRHAAVATSGDVYQFVEIDGVRYSHIIDPRKGLGITNRVQVSVVADHCIKADAWASAICVLGGMDADRQKALGLRVFLRR